MPMAVRVAAVLAVGLGLALPVLAGDFAEPDPHLTPGGIDSAAVAQICASDGQPGSAYSRARRHTTSQERRADFARYGVPWARRSGYEDDHRVPLCLGGADIAGNRWPQPFGEALAKDELERAACRAVCRGVLPLATAQHRFFGDWVAAYREAFGREPVNSYLGP